jgi:hypothetical protein
MDEQAISYSKFGSNQQWEQQRYQTLRDDLMHAFTRIVNLEQQVANQALETRRLKGELNPHMYPEPEHLKSQAAHQQATAHLYNPLRNEAPSMRGDVAAIVAMKAFIERFLHPDDLGYAVSARVRDDAREALGRARVES